MKTIVRVLALLPLTLPILMTGQTTRTNGVPNITEIGGQKVVTLTRKAVSASKPEFTSITVLPGRGMEVLQVTANFPGKGNMTCYAHQPG